MARLILPTEYLMGRDIQNPLTMSQAYNMADLLARVNWLLAQINADTKVTSGYRPAAINAATGGAKMSSHMTCQAVDLAGNHLAVELMGKPQLLEEAGLYMEHPDFTKGKFEGWLHLQTRPTKNRIFRP